MDLEVGRRVSSRWLGGRGVVVREAPHSGWLVCVPGAVAVTVLWGGDAHWIVHPEGL